MSTRVDAARSAVPSAELEQASVGSGRWIALVFIAVSQLMVALDNTIVSIALPSVQRDLAASDASRQWMITAYTLAFGGLLLLGGRVADFVGGRRAFLVGLVGFAAASALGGAAVNFEVLVAARALQGAFAALLTPTALSLVSVTFTEPAERAKAFAVYGAVAGSGAAAGLIVGGVLTEYVSWRWTLFVNVPIAILAAIGAAAVLRKAPPGFRPRLDIPGALLVTGGLVGLVYGFSTAAIEGWAATGVLGPLAGAVALLAVFVAVQARVTSPLLPLPILRDRNRAASNLAVGLTVAALLGVYLFLTFYLQVVLGYTPVQTGFAFLPLTVAVLFSAGAIASRLLPRFGPRALMVPGLLVATAGVGMLTQLRVDGGYFAIVLPAEILIGLGIGCVFAPAISTATSGVDRRDAGVASAVVTTSQMVGGSLGTALLNTIAASGAAAYAASHPGVGDAAGGLVHGFSLAAGWGAGMLATAALIAAVLINVGKSEPSCAAGKDD